MQEQQQTEGMATPDGAAPVSGKQIQPKEPKPNRRMKRAQTAIKKKIHRAAERVQGRRLDNFKTLQQWKQNAKGLTQEQTDSVFRVALAKLFKKDFADRGSFEQQLKAIVRNVKDGFKYKADVAPMIPKEAPAEPAP